MSISGHIGVNTRYTRSINIERDRGSSSLVATYLPTVQGIRILEETAGALSREDQPRAWTLVGPYGSGKSSFALFLHELLGPAGAAKNAAKTVLAASRPDLARRFSRKGECFRVALTGSNDSLANQLLAAMDEAATEFWSGAKGRKPLVLEEIRRMRKRKRFSDNDLLGVLRELQAAVERKGANGFLIVIDELGKFLEYETRNSESGIFLLQQLAEMAYAGRRANLLLFVLLHQGFDLYAKGMGEKVKNDWAKVQGRFQNVSFVETTDQILRIVASAFSNSLTSTQREVIDSQVEIIATDLSDAGALPPGLTVDDATRIFASCYPLHPISLLALPQLCQRFAQNERTLFSYLASREPHGFQASLDAFNRIGDWILPSEIHDYFVHNQHTVLADPLVHRRWAEVTSAIERAEGKRHSIENSNPVNSDSLILAKTIGVLNLISRTGGLRATEPVLKSLFSDDAEFRQAMQSLLDLSIVQYRRFSDEFRVWQGTDFDIDQRTQDEKERIGAFNLAELLSKRSVTAPVLARRHSIRSGALRYFTVSFVSASEKLPSASTTTNEPRIVFYLCETRDDIHEFEKAKSHAGPNEIWARYTETTAIRAAIAEVLALEGVSRSSQELSSDPVANREVRERLFVAQATERDALKRLIGEPNQSDWYWQNESLNIPDTQTLQRILSDVMDSIYDQTPIIRNELICRDQISAQAAAARNKLFYQMLNHADQAQLGIAKYPAERAIYRSLLEKGLLHVKRNSRWELQAPDDSDPLNLIPMWERMAQLFAASESDPISLQSIMTELAKPPYGVKRGVFPVLFLHYYLLHRHEIAVYDELTYAPSLTYEHLERMVRRPDQYTFQRFRIEGIRESLFDAYSKALFGEVRNSINLLDLAKPLTQFFLGLDEYAKTTKRLSETAVRVRQAFLLSKSPEKFILDELPAACEMDKAADFSGFADRLISALRELKNAQSQLYLSMRGAFCECFGLSATMTLSDLRTALRKRCTGLEQFTLDVDGLKSLIRRVCDPSSSDEVWFDRILLFLGRKPVSSWTDQDRDFTEYRLIEFAKRLVEIERIRLHYDSTLNESRDHEVILVKTISNLEGELDEVVSLYPRDREAIAEAKQRIRNALSSVNDPELELAIVAQVTKDFLTAYRRGNLQKSGVKDVAE